MSDKVKHKNCKKCQKITLHRMVNDCRINRKIYYSCSNCMENHSKKYRDTHRLRYLAQKANSRKRPDSIKMTEEILQNIYDNQEGKCALSGLKFSMNSSDRKPSLDRIDSNKGYTLTNIQLVSYFVNKMKRELNQSDFIKICGCIWYNKGQK